jgi:hypothetical protein
MLATPGMPVTQEMLATPGMPVTQEMLVTLATQPLPEALEVLLPLLQEVQLGLPEAPPPLAPLAVPTTQR